MKTEMGVTFGSLGVLGTKKAPGVAMQAQELGFESFWTVEATGTDAFTLLGAASMAAPKLDLGTGIIPIQLRSPTLAAMSAASLQALNPEVNTLLGVGVSAPGILTQHGIDAAEKPIRLMREYVALLRECFSGEQVNFEGDYFSTKKFRLGIKPVEKKPKIIMAALNPQMLKLAGEIADGVLLNYLPATHVEPSIKRVREGGNAKIYAYVHASVTDFEKAQSSARRDLFNYAMADGYARMFSEAGFADEGSELREKQRNRDREGALAAISEEMIQAIDFIGSPSEVKQFVSSYAEAGVDHSILMPMPWGEDRNKVAVETMEAAISSTK
ncbi:MAG: hypothetical protein CMQ40_02615 [Gammaproteobacteria bacterium]|nr:hypothetical protein [Gammaproteobacteria bacterium]